jgi:hypothetical protein
MPYGQKEGNEINSIDLYALRAKEKTKLKQFSKSSQNLFNIL